MPSLNPNPKGSASSTYSKGRPEGGPHELLSELPAVEFGEVEVGGDGVVAHFVSPSALGVQLPEEEIGKIFGQEGV